MSSKSDSVILPHWKQVKTKGKIGAIIVEESKGLCAYPVSWPSVYSVCITRETGEKHSGQEAQRVVGMKVCFLQTLQMGND